MSDTSLSPSQRVFRSMPVLSSLILLPSGESLVVRPSAVVMTIIVSVCVIVRRSDGSMMSRIASRLRAVASRSASGRGASPPPRPMRPRPNPPP